MCAGVLAINSEWSGLMTMRQFSELISAIMDLLILADLLFIKLAQYIIALKPVSSVIYVEYVSALVSAESVV